MADNKINVGGRLHSIATGNVLAGADEILDDSKGKKQSEVNTDIDNALADRYTKDETYNKNELNNLITTPNVQYVTVVATEQTTVVTDILPSVGAANTIYRVGKWNGSQYNTAVYSEYAWDGNTYVLLNVKEYGIDNKPVAGSDNLVKSGGVFEELTELAGEVDYRVGGVLKEYNGTVAAYATFLTNVPLKANVKYIFHAKITNAAVSNCIFVIKDSSNTTLKEFTITAGNTEVEKEYTPTTDVVTKYMISYGQNDAGNVTFTVYDTSIVTIDVLNKRLNKYFDGEIYNNSFSVIGSGLSQQVLKIADGDNIESVYYLNVREIIYPQGVTNPPAIYFRTFDINGNKLDNFSFYGSNKTYTISPSDGSVRWQLLFFCTVTGTSSVGFEYGGAVTLSIKSYAENILDEFTENIVTTETINLFNPNPLLLINECIRNDDGSFTFASLNANNLYSNGYPLDVTFKANTPYTLYFECYNTDLPSSYSGFDFVFEYTDSTSELIYTYSGSSFKKYHATSKSSKTLSKIKITCGHNGITNIRNIMLVEGDSYPSLFIPYNGTFCAIDSAAREKIFDEEKAITEIKDYIGGEIYNDSFTVVGNGKSQQSLVLAEGSVYEGMELYLKVASLTYPTDAVSAARIYFRSFDANNNVLDNNGYLTGEITITPNSSAVRFQLLFFCTVSGNSVVDFEYGGSVILSANGKKSIDYATNLEEEPSSLGDSKISASSAVDFPYSAFNLHRKESYTPDPSLVSNAYINIYGGVLEVSSMRLIRPIQLNAGEIFIIKCSGQNDSGVAIISECSATGGNVIPIFEGRRSVETYVYYAVKACYIAVSYWNSTTCLMWKVPACSISSISRYITEIAGSIENAAYYANAAYRGNIVTKSLTGDGRVQQAITVAAGDFEHDSTYIKVQGTISVSETYTNAPALYVRQFDANETKLYNSSVNSDGSIIKINKSSGAVRYQVLMFATVTGSSIVGATYTANVKVWQEKDSYEEFMQLKTQVDSLEVDNINIEQRLFGLTDKEVLNPEHTTDGRYIRWNGGTISDVTPNSMRITVPIALEQGQIIVLHASTLNDVVSAITLCDANGGNRIPVVRGKSTKDYFVYFATSDCYVRLCYYTDDTAIYRINKNALKEIIDKLIEPLNPTGYNIGVDGDSVTEGGQWARVACNILVSNLYNVAVGSACWSYKQRNNIAGTGLISPQSYSDQNFAGFGGASDLSTDENIQKWVNNNACTHIEKFISLVDAGTYPEPDIFVFAMGTNGDTGNGNREGTVDEAMSPADISDANFVVDGKSLKYSMCGAMRWCIQTIKEAYPNCRVYVSLPIQRASYNTNKTYLYPKIQLIREMAVQMGCQIIDQYNGCGITAAIELDASPYGPYLRDGLHPNTNGQQLMGKYAAKVIQSTMF